MACSLVARVWNLEAALSSVEKLVLLKLADVAGDDSVVFVPQGLRGLAPQCGLDRGAFRQVIARLVARGHLIDRGSYLVLAVVGDQV
jgi:hypothetical protein